MIVLEKGLNDDPLCQNQFEKWCERGRVDEGTE